MEDDFFLPSAGSFGVPSADSFSVPPLTSWVPPLSQSVAPVSSTVPPLPRWGARNMPRTVSSSSTPPGALIKAISEQLAQEIVQHGSISATELLEAISVRPIVQNSDGSLQILGRDSDLETAIKNEINIPKSGDNTDSGKVECEGLKPRDLSPLHRLSCLLPEEHVAIFFDVYYRRKKQNEHLWMLRWELCKELLLMIWGLCLAGFENIYLPHGRHGVDD